MVSCKIILVITWQFHLIFLSHQFINVHIRDWFYSIYIKEHCLSFSNTILSTTIQGLSSIANLCLSHSLIWSLITCFLIKFLQKQDFFPAKFNTKILSICWVQGLFKARMEVYILDPHLILSGGKEERLQKKTVLWKIQYTKKRI